jgi:hypothetical protein
MKQKRRPKKLTKQPTKQPTKPPTKQPLIRFYRFIPGAREPQRADRAAAGSMPLRAFRYCEAMTTASAFGWYLFPPMSFSLMWDGRLEVLWTYEGADGWFPLKRAQFPNFAPEFDKAAPEDVRGYSPPFLGASTDGEPGLIQVWTGWVARTAADWSLLVRPPANIPRSLGVESYEGIVETDRWFGPLFVNMRLIRTLRHGAKPRRHERGRLGCLPQDGRAPQAWTAAPPGRVCGGNPKTPQRQGDRLAQP